MKDQSSKRSIMLRHNCVRNRLVKADPFYSMCKDFNAFYTKVYLKITEG